MYRNAGKPRLFCLLFLHCFHPSGFKPVKVALNLIDFYILGYELVLNHFLPLSMTCQTIGGNFE